MTKFETDKTYDTENGGKAVVLEMHGPGNRMYGRVTCLTDRDRWTAHSWPSNGEGGSLSLREPKEKTWIAVCLYADNSVSAHRASSEQVAWAYQKVIKVFGPIELDEPT